MKKYEKFLLKHPEAAVFFGLVEDLETAGLPFYCNVTDYDLDELDRLADEDGGSVWDDFDLLVEVQAGELAAGMHAPVSAEFDGTDFLVNDAEMHTEYRNMTQKEAFAVFKNFFERR